MVTLSASCKTEEEKKLESLFADGKYPFTNILGEAPEIAEFIKTNQVSGVSEISFVIGGSNGLSNDVIKASKLVLSFVYILIKIQAVITAMANTKMKP